MDRSPETPAKESNGGVFSRNGPIFGGGNKTPTSSRPSTSSGSRRTNNTSQSSTISTATAPSTSSPSLTRKASYTLLTKSPKPTTKIRTSSFGASFVVPNFASPEKRRPPTSFKTATNRKASDSSFHVLDNYAGESGETAPAPASERDSWTSTTAYARMLAHLPGGENKQKSGSTAGLTGASILAQALANAPPSPSLEAITYQHIQEMASKRISTLDYLRKAYGALPFKYAIHC